MSYIQTGCLDYEELSSLRNVPSDKRYAKGPVAVIECVQCIPCNPCESSCPSKAIKIGNPITNLPQIDEDKCIGCGICVSKCPGMAIFVVDKTFDTNTATVGFPYEYYPIPEKGDKVSAVDRKGDYVCDAQVVKVQNPTSFDRTPVVTISIPLDKANDVRFIKRIKA